MASGFSREPVIARGNDDALSFAIASELMDVRVVGQAQPEVQAPARHSVKVRSSRDVKFSHRSVRRLHPLVRQRKRSSSGATCLEHRRTVQPLTRSWIIAPLVALVLVTASCAAEPAENPAPGGGANVEASNENAPAEESNTAEFETIELEGALVDSFPRDVPLYNALVLESSASLGPVTELPEWGVLMTTNDAFDAVDADIRSTYSSNGWTIGMDSQFGGGTLLTARGNGYMLSITYTDYGEDGVSITYGVSQL